MVLATSSQTQVGTQVLDPKWVVGISTKHLLGVILWTEAVCLFPAVQIQNNHTEIILSITLLDQFFMHIASYILYLKLTHFHYFAFCLKACGLMVVNFLGACLLGRYMEYL